MYKERTGLWDTSRRGWHPLNADTGKPIPTSSGLGCGQWMHGSDTPGRGARSDFASPNRSGRFWSRSCRSGRAWGGCGNNAIHSGEAAAANRKQNLFVFKSADRFDDFDLNNDYFTTLSATDLKVKVFGFDDREKVATKVLTLDTDREFIRFGAQFDDIDAVRVTAKGGTDADPNDGIRATQFYAVDDLF